MYKITLEIHFHTFTLLHFWHFRFSWALHDFTWQIYLLFYILHFYTFTQYSSHTRLYRYTVNYTVEILLIYSWNTQYTQYNTIKIQLIHTRLYRYTVNYTVDTLLIDSTTVQKKIQYTTLLHLTHTKIYTKIYFTHFRFSWALHHFTWQIYFIIYLYFIH